MDLNQKSHDYPSFTPDDDQTTQAQQSYQQETNNSQQYIQNQQNPNNLNNQNNQQYIPQYNQFQQQYLQFQQQPQNVQMLQQHQYVPQQQDWIYHQMNQQLQQQNQQQQQFIQQQQHNNNVNQQHDQTAIPILNDKERKKWEKQQIQLQKKQMQEEKKQIRLQKQLEKDQERALKQVLKEQQKLEKQELKSQLQQQKQSKQPENQEKFNQNQNKSQIQVKKQITKSGEALNALKEQQKEKKIENLLEKEKILQEKLQQSDLTQKQQEKINNQLEKVRKSLQNIQSPEKLIKPSQKNEKQQEKYTALNSQQKYIVDHSADITIYSISQIFAQLTLQGVKDQNKTQRIKQLYEQSQARLTNKIFQEQNPQILSQIAKENKDFIKNKLLQFPQSSPQEILLLLLQHKKQDKVSKVLEKQILLNQYFYDLNQKINFLTQQGFKDYRKILQFLVQNDLNLEATQQQLREDGQINQMCNSHFSIDVKLQFIELGVLEDKQMLDLLQRNNYNLQNTLDYLKNESEKQNLQQLKNEKQEVWKQHLKPKFQEELAPLIRESITDNIQKLYVDGNNMFFIENKIRQIFLNCKTKPQAQQIIISLLKNFLSKNPQIKECMLVFDQTKETLQSQNLIVHSAKPNFKTSDDYLVFLANIENNQNQNNSLFITSDNGLSIRLKETKVQNIMKSGLFLTLLKNYFGEDNYNQFVDSQIQTQEQTQQP